MANTKLYNLEPSEDTVQCFFYCPSLKAYQKSWEQLCENLNTSIAASSQGYLWHRDEFKVFIPLLDKNNESNLPYLTSSTCFGDNIEDEWFIVYIVKKLTTQFTDLIVQVKDNDGDFLLIEAADYLPSWANPDSTENRVFIYKGEIHIIPQDLASIDTGLSVRDALLCISDNQHKTQASLEIQNVILNRIGDYPQKIKENTHSAIVQLPFDVAAVLKLHPNLISPIVDTYCHHDIIDIKACKTLDYQNNVTVTVKFTKCLYAMLLHSKVIKNLMRSTEKDKSIVLGKKITCGYKMIMNGSLDIYSSKEYQKFLKSLTDNGYFKCNIEGSHEYKQLLEKAKSFFTSVECPIISNVASKMTDIINSDDYVKTIELLKGSESSDLVEDDEDWLNIHPEQLNNLLKSRYGKKSKFEKNDIITPQNIAAELTDFLQKTSDYEGIEAVDNEDTTNDEIDFNADDFANCLEKMLNLLTSGGEKQDSNYSDEGMSESDDDDDAELTQELQAKLQDRGKNLKDTNSILHNLRSSMREEQASSGPTSNLMNTLGLNKTDFLDSDDD